MKPKLIIIIGILAITFVLGLAAFFYWKNIPFNPPFARTQQGLLLEDLIPQHVNFVVSFNPTDGEEEERFWRLWDGVFQQNKDAVIPFVFSKFLSNSTVPIERNKLKFLVAGYLADSYPNFFFLFSGPSEKDLHMLVNSIQKANPRLYTGVMGDVGFATNDQADFTAVAEKKHDSFSKQKIFAAAFSPAERGKKPMSGYAFLNTAGYLWPSSVSAVRLQAGKNGLLMNSTLFDEYNNLAEVNLASFLQPSNVSLFHSVPGENLLLYLESHHLGNLILAALDENLFLGGPKSAFTKEERLMALEKSTGINFEADLLPFMQKGFALAVHKSGMIIPSISIYIDANGATEKAEQLVKKLDSALSAWIYAANSAMQTSDKKPVLEQEKFISMKQGSILRIYLNKIPDTLVHIPLFQFFDKPLEISYGITSDKLLFFSTMPQFEKNMSEGLTVADTPLFKESAALDEKQPGNLLIIDAERLLRYTDEVAGKFRNKKSLSPEEDSAFELIKKYIFPIKSYIQISQGDFQKLRGKAFLKIQTAH